MATSELMNGILALEGNTLSIFGNAGFVHGKSWVMDFGVNVEVEPAPASPEILNLIESDIRDGKGEKVHHIVVNPNTGLCLFLEGKLSRADIEKAEVLGDEAVIFNDVPFTTADGVKRVYPVVVVPNPEFKIATMDEENKVV